MILNFTTYVKSFIVNANHVILNEQINYNAIIKIQNLPCHIQSVRIKSFPSAQQKMAKLNVNDLYYLHDLIAFRYVFYNKIDLLKFYHHARLERNIVYTKNYINEKKDNGYSALHFRYKNEYEECPVKILECQLFVIDDYYDAIYGNAKYFKNYTNYDFSFS